MLSKKLIEYYVHLACRHYNIRELRQERRQQLQKISLKKWIRAASNFIALILFCLICQMLAIFLEFNSKGLYRSSGKEKESCCLAFPSLTKREIIIIIIRHFHTVVLQWQQRNVQKSMMHMQSCCFATINLLLFCHSSYCCRYLSSLFCTHLLLRRSHVDLLTFQTINQNVQTSWPSVYNHNLLK